MPRDCVSSSGTALLTTTLAVLSLCCSNVAAVDVSSERVCMTSPSTPFARIPVLPLDLFDGALLGPDWPFDASSIPDGGYDSTLASPTLAWSVALDFRRVLSRLPSATSAAHLELDVQLSSLELKSDSSLDMLDEIEVQLAFGAAGAAAARPNGSAACGGGLSDLVVASYRHSDERSDDSVVSPKIASTDLDAYNCMSSRPAEFRVLMTLREGQLPRADATLSLTSCISARASARYP